MTGTTDGHHGLRPTPMVQVTCSHRCRRRSRRGVHRWSLSRQPQRWKRAPRNTIVPISGMLIISLCFRPKPHLCTCVLILLFGCAPVGVSYVTSDFVQPNRFATDRLSSTFSSTGTLYDRLASTVLKRGMIPELLPERK